MWLVEEHLEHRQVKADKVVSLRGDAIIGNTEPDAEVIEMLEGLLEEAKAGELRGLGYSAVFQNNRFRNDWTGDASAIVLYGSLGFLVYELSKAIDAMD